MSTTTPLTDAINALTTYANSVTGASDTTLSDAVDTLAAGYGSGGSGYTAEEIADGSAPTGAVTLSSTATIREGAFWGSPITSLISATVTQIAGSVCRNCTSLTMAYLSAVTKITNTYAFSGCTSLTQLAIPALTSFSPYLCSGDTALTTVDLGMISSMLNSTFTNCNALRTLILRQTSGAVTTNWYNANVFGGIYNNPTESTIYVPSALISAYQSATNWSTAYSAGVTFAAIEGSAYESTSWIVD